MGLLLLAFVLALPVNAQPVSERCETRWRATWTAS
jgi:hypothetical protein